MSRRYNKIDDLEWRAKTSDLPSGDQAGRCLKRPSSVIWTSAGSSALTLGIVLNIGGRNYLTLTDTRDSVLVGDASDTTISAELRGSSKNPLSARVKFLDETATN